MRRAILRADETDWSSSWWRDVPTSGTILRVSVLVLGILALPRHGDDDLKPGAFLRDYKAALKRLQAGLTRISVEGSVWEVIDRKTGEPPIRDHVYEIDYLTDGRHEKLQEIYHRQGYLERIYVLGDRAFALRRDAASDPYLLDELDTLPSSFLREIKECKQMFLHAAFSVGNEDLPSLVNSPGFFVRALDRVDHGGVALVRVEFGYRPRDPKTEWDMAGWMMLDPARDWAVVEHEVRRKVPNAPPEQRYEKVITGNVRYTDGDGCASLPQEVSVSLLNLIPNGKKIERRCLFQSAHCSTGPVSTDAFTLASYGMGDVDRPPGRPTNKVAYWAFGIAVVAIVASAVLRWMSGSR